MSDRGERAAAVRVTRGQPGDTEVAALTAVLTGIAAQNTAPAAESVPLSVWADRATLLRRLPAPGPGTWRASALPFA